MKNKYSTLWEMVALGGMLAILLAIGALTILAIGALTIICHEEEPKPPYFPEAMKLDQIEQQLKDPGIGARTYTVLGVEAEGRYFWFCDETWVEIVDPCKQLTWLFGGEAHSFFPDVPNHTLQELCEEGIEQVCFNCPGGS